MRRLEQSVLTIVVFGVSFCVSVLAAMIIFEDVMSITLTVALDVEEQQQNDVLQIYWRSMEGAFSEQASRSFPLHKGYQTFVLDLGHFTNFPAVIRIDPTSGAGHVRIRRVCLRLFFPFYCLTSGNDFQMVVSYIDHIDEIRYDPRGLIIKTQQNDPFIDLLTPPQVAQRVFVIEMVAAVVCSAVVTVGFRHLYAQVRRSRRRRTRREREGYDVKGQQR